MNICCHATVRPVCFGVLDERSIGGQVLGYLQWGPRRGICLGDVVRVRCWPIIVLRVGGFWFLDILLIARARSAPQAMYIRCGFLLFGN